MGDHLDFILNDVSNVMMLRFLDNTSASILSLDLSKLAMCNRLFWTVFQDLVPCKNNILGLY